MRTYTCRISVYGTKEEKEFYRTHSKKLGFKHMAEFFRVAANEMISKHDKNQPRRIQGIMGSWE